MTPSPHPTDVNNSTCVVFLGGTAHAWSCVSSVYHFFLLFGYWPAPAFLVLCKFCVRLPHQHCHLALLICCFDPSPPHLCRTVSVRTRKHAAWGLRVMFFPHPSPTSLEEHIDTTDWARHVQLQRNLTCVRRVVVRTTCHVAALRPRWGEPSLGPGRVSPARPVGSPLRPATEQGTQLPHHLVTARPRLPRSIGANHWSRGFAGPCKTCPPVVFGGPDDFLGT